MSSKRVDIKSGKVDSLELKALARDVIRLSNLFTRERENLPPGYLTDEGLRRAYIHYFLPANINKIHTPFQELPSWGCWNTSHPAGKQAAPSLISRQWMRFRRISPRPSRSLLTLHAR